MFSSQFDRVRRFSDAYAGESGETRMWTPAKVALAGVGVAAAAGLVAADFGDDDAFMSDAAFEDGTSGDQSGGDGGAWSVHSDWTDASVGGDGEGFMYFSDGDTSFTVDG